MKNFKLIIIALFAVSILFVSCEKEKSSFNDLYSFGFQDVEVHGLISRTIIEVYVPYGTDYSNLIPQGEIPEGATITPAFGTALDFTEDVIFTITAEDGTEKAYTIKLYVDSYTTFEELALTETGYWNGSDESGEFVSGNVTFKNSYNTAWSSWSGFAYSNLIDVTTTGFGNQYSTYAGVGANDSKKFGLTSIFGTAELIFTVPTTSEEIYLTNATYSALSMKEGDNYAKKFGGETGNDKDWFLLTIEGFDTSDQSTGTVEVYLADYRFDNSTEDYIVKDWIKTDLTTLGEIKKLTFSLSSSDNGDYGMNTPAYFCMDNLYGIVKK